MICLDMTTIRIKKTGPVTTRLILNVSEGLIVAFMRLFHVNFMLQFEIKKV